MGFIFAFLLSLTAFSQDVLDTLQTFYPAQARAVLEARVAEGRKSGAFGLWRSFPPLFYHLALQHPSPVITARRGLCAGDAHLENFGFLPLGEKSRFTLNDLDDATDCPLDLDLLRLLIGHRLAGGTNATASLLAGYQQGLKGEACEKGKYLQKREKKSLEGGRRIEKDFLSEGKPTCPGPDYVPVNQDELLELKFFHELRDGSTFLGGCTRTKLYGGSAGEKRFAVLYQNADQSFGVYELKPLVRTAYEVALNPDRSLDEAARASLFLRALLHFFDPEAGAHFFPVPFAGRPYQLRPRWEGNKGVKLDDLEDLEERNQVMRAEACVLGQLHGETAEDKDVVLDVAAWDDYVKMIEEKFKGAFTL